MFKIFYNFFKILKKNKNLSKMAKYPFGPYLVVATALESGYKNIVPAGTRGGSSLVQRNLLCTEIC